MVTLEKSSKLALRYSTLKTKHRHLLTRGVHIQEVIKWSRASVKKPQEPWFNGKLYTLKDKFCQYMYVLTKTYKHTATKMSRRQKLCRNHIKGRDAGSQFFQKWTGWVWICPCQDIATRNVCCLSYFKSECRISSWNSASPIQRNLTQRFSVHIILQNQT